MQAFLLILSCFLVFWQLELFQMALNESLWARGANGSADLIQSPMCDLTSLQVFTICHLSINTGPKLQVYWLFFSFCDIEHNWSMKENVKEEFYKKNLSLIEYFDLFVFDFLMVWLDCNLLFAFHLSFLNQAHLFLPISTYYVGSKSFPLLKSKSWLLCH